MNSISFCTYLLKIDIKINSKFPQSLSNYRIFNVKHISLRQSKIQSIERISRMEMVQIESIWIDDNLITRIADFKKAVSLKNLKILYISKIYQHVGNNPIKDCESLTSAHQILQRIHLDYVQDPEMVYNLMWIFKLKGNKLERIEVKSQQRTRQKYEFSKKFPGLL